MPFKKSYDWFYKTILKIAKGFSIEIIRADKEFLSEPVMESISENITNSDYIITLIGDDHNANVFYELGISHTKKPFSRVLIFKDQNEKYQFDIQHIRQHTLDSKNSKSAKDIIKKFFQLNENANSLENALYSIEYFRSNPTICDNVIQFLRQDYSMICDSISNIVLSQRFCDSLNVIIPVLKDAVIKKSLTYIENTVKLDEQLIIGLYVLYSEIISKTIGFYDHSNDINGILQNMAIDNKFLYVFATSLIDKGIMLNECLSWLISYFGKNDVHRIDLSRHRIEEFLVLSNLEETNKALIQALSNNVAHVREYCAEVIREKRLNTARQALLEQLKIEDNLYTARSIIDALCELSIQSKTEQIENYNAIKTYKERIKCKPDEFIMRHINFALDKFT